MDKDFATRLAQILQDLHIPKSNLALNLDVSPAAVTGWLNGKKPMLGHLIQLSKTLNISLDWLITGRGPAYLHGPLHLSPHEENILLLLRNLPQGSIDTLIQLLSGLTSSNDTTMIQRAKMAKTMQAADLAMIMLDADQRILDINNAYLQMLNLHSAEKDSVLGLPFMDWVTGDKANMMLQLKQAADNNTSINMRIEHIRRHDTSTVTAFVSGIYRKSDGNAFFLLTAFYQPKN